MDKYSTTFHLQDNEVKKPIFTALCNLWSAKDVLTQWKAKMRVSKTQERLGDTYSKRPKPTGLWETHIEKDITIH